MVYENIGLVWTQKSLVHCFNTIAKPNWYKTINLHHLGVIIVITLLACLMSGCATIISGTEQDLHVKPADAQLKVYTWDGKLFSAGKTNSDATVTVHRPTLGKSYLILVQKDGYCPQYWLTSAEENAVSYLSIAGSIIDRNTGAGYSYTPTEFHLNIEGTQPCGL